MAKSNIFVGLDSARFPGARISVVTFENGPPIDAPIVMLTARGDTLDVVEGLESGADEFLPTMIYSLFHAKIEAPFANLTFRCAVSCCSTALSTNFFQLCLLNTMGVD